MLTEPNHLCLVNGVSCLGPAIPSAVPVKGRISIPSFPTCCGRGQGTRTKVAISSWPSPLHRSWGWFFHLMSSRSAHPHPLTAGTVLLYIPWRGTGPAHLHILQLVRGEDNFPQFYSEWGVEPTVCIPNLTAFGGNRSYEHQQRLRLWYSHVGSMVLKRILNAQKWS